MNENLPMKVDEEFELKTIKKRNIKRIRDDLKRVGKIVRKGFIGSAGLILFAAGGNILNPTISGIVSALGFTTFLGGYLETIANILYKRYNDMMFVTARKLNGEISIWQDIKSCSKFFEILKDYNSNSKAAVMGLQLIVRTSKI